MTGIDRATEGQAERMAQIQAEHEAGERAVGHRDALVALLIENRRTDYPISAYLFDPPVMADAILDAGWTPPALDQLVRQKVILAVIAEHRRVRNVRSCSAGGCAWRPTRSGRNGDEAAMLARHADFNAHLADTIVDRLAQL